ncbi:MAG: N-acetylmuramoyl-L-alanine amidase [Acidimicrobiia bacterium]
MADDPVDPGRRAALGLLGAAAAGLVAWRWVGASDPIGSAAPTRSSTSTTEAATTTSSGAPTTSSSTTTAEPESTTTTETTTTTAEPATTTTSEPATTTTTEPATTTTTEPATTTTTEPVTTTTTEPATTTTAAGTGVALVTVVSKGSWGAAPTGSGFVGHALSRLTLHHTASPLTNGDDPARKWRNTQAYHQSQGWPDVAYHLGVDLAGRAYEGRPFEYRGDTFTEYDPSGHFLICCMGNYDAASPPAAMVETTARLFAWAVTRFGIDPGTLGGHRDHAATTCPGSNLHARLPGIRTRIDQLVAVGVELRWA